MNSEEIGIFYGVLSFLWVEYLWELYLTLRQQNIYRRKVQIPIELVDIFSDETYNKARFYGKDRNVLTIFYDLINIIITTLYIFFGYQYFWNLSHSAISNLEYSEYNEIPQSIIFFLIINTIDSITPLPIIMYNIFVIEEKYGFNNQTIRFFIKDNIKKFIAVQILMLPSVTLLILVIKFTGPYFFIYLWSITQVMVLFCMIIYPNLIAPLFDKYTTLPEGELRTRIEELAAQVKFPLYRIYVVKGSQRSSHSNAYLYGCYKNKRIVLFDTLIKDYKSSNTNEESSSEGCDNDEVLAVLAHEMGHWYHNHQVKIFIIMQVNFFLCIGVFAYLFEYKAMYTAFGFSGQRPVLIGLIIVMLFILKPYNTLFTFGLAMLSRHFEYQADAFAANLGMSVHLRQALIKLYKDNLIFPFDDRLYSFWHFSHPSLLQRFGALINK